MRFIVAAIGAVLFLSVNSPAAEWQITQLDNGLKVMILENRQVPQVNISTTIKVGAKNESDFFDGATHLLEHLILFRGTEEMTGDQLAAAMKKHGAYFNGYTSSDWTDFVITLPKENADFAFKIHADMLFRSNFPAAEMDQERQAVLEEININEDDPFSKAYLASVKVLYGSRHPYSKTVLGSKENVSSVPRDSVYAYYKRYYAPNNMTTVVVGDISAADALALVRKYFGNIPRGVVAVDNYNTPPSRTKIDSIEIKKDVAQAYLMMMSIGPKADSPDQFALDLIATILGNGESSRLWKKLRDQDGLVYSVSYSINMTKYEGSLSVSATLDPANLPKAVEAMNDVLNETRKNGFTEEELRRAKNKIKTNHYAGMERGLDCADRYAEYDSFIGYKFVEDYPTNIENVTLARLNEVARKYINTDSYVKTTVVPK